jgi:hypothetical protein
MQGWKLVTLAVLALLLSRPTYSDNYYDGLMLAESDYEQQRREAQRRYLEMRERERQQKKQQEAVEKHNEQVRARNCKVARNRQHKYSTAGGLYVFDKKGKKVYLDKAARARAEKQAAADVKKWCR